MDELVPSKMLGDDTIVPSVGEIIGDAVSEPSVPRKRKYRRKQATIKQIRAIQYINQGMSKRAAMIKAGYTVTSASHPKQALMQKPAVRKILSDMKEELQDAGLTSIAMVDKFKEWLYAEKVQSSMTEPDKLVPDYKTQLAAYDRWKAIMDKDIEGENGTVKRKLTIEEFVTGENQS